MTITISLNIQLDATDPAVLDAQLAAISRNLFTRSPTSCTTVTAPAAPPRAMAVATPARSGRPAKRPATIEPTAQEGPETHRTDVRRPDTPANAPTPEIAPILPATNEAETPKPAKRPRSGDRLPFAEFDTLVGKELKRLSVDGRIPTAGLWDEQRDRRLPMYNAVMQRYGCTNLATFAEKMGMQPPLSKAFTINQNGANAIHNKEATHAAAA